MKMKGIVGGTEKDCALAEMLRTLDAECRKCAPLSPIECISRCNVWKMKNELRRLREAMNSPNFMKDLLNVLKNNTRLLVLKAIVKRRYSMDKLQEELSRAGYLHSRETLHQDYVRPLVAVGLAAETREEYYATTFGSRLNQLVGDFSEFVTVLPSHSSCYEESLLEMLLFGPRTFEEIEAFVSSKVAPRVLKRLKKAGLVQAPAEKDYVFFFRSKRDFNREFLSSSEKKVCHGISEEGISVKKLVEKTGFSMRKTYKCLRKLRGKKLVFTRRTPKVYCLTDEGAKLASLLRELQNIVEETRSFSKQIVDSGKS